MDIGADLGKLLKGTVLEAESLARHTTYGVGGPVSAYITPCDRNDLAIALDFARKNEIAFFLIGQGSNLLVSDDGFTGIAISLNKHFKLLEINANRITAETGLSLQRLVRESIKNNLTGLEGLSGVPGTLGGALMMNAGAYGAEISNHLIAVEVIDPHGKTSTILAENIDFSYRQSGFNPNDIILRAEFELNPGKPEDISHRCRMANKARKSSQPLNKRSAGSVFKNPSLGLAAGYLIDQCGLKGTRIGDAEISNKHANFIINRGSATAKEILSLIQLVQKKVAAKFNINLELEIKILGFDPVLIS
ncbi:MAG: UDP-N-acetylmuramate dehydrogenase [Candidatus Marinimicrobia bacterium]|nr:UDP-N-acetylmuramate dehydrogenase [Candidatus Neomarinimicrobiota bacterium]